MTQPKNKPPPRPPPRPNAPQSAAPTRLKVVTVSPGRASLADTEVSAGQERTVRQDPYLGATIDGRYKVEAILGQGGMGVVYRCSHTIIGKKVAMKVLRADLAREPEVTERFLNEAKAASAIGNPHIIDISDFGQFPDGATYFIMEYLGGTPLSKTIEGNRPLPTERILHIAVQLAEGLAAAHAAGIVHRDLKPDNIFLIDRGGQKDFVKILDFGIAKVSTSDEGKLTRAGTVFGTPHYMSPEQASGAPVDQRGDVYSLGVIFYELACGRVPFEADNFMGILTQHMYKAPAPPRTLVSDPETIPIGLQAIVLKCLCKKPEDRYESMEELLADVQRLRLGTAPQAVADMSNRTSAFKLPPGYFDDTGSNLAPSSRTAPELYRPRRWPWIAGVAGATLIGTVVALTADDSGVQKVAAPPIAPERSTRSTSAASLPRASDPPTPEVRRVVVAAEPLEAHIFREGEDLGPSPVMIPLKSGERAELVARRAGYRDATVSIDGTNPRAVIKLEKIASPVRAHTRPKVPAKGETPKQAPVDTGEIVNPWK